MITIMKAMVTIVLVKRLKSLRAIFKCLQRFIQTMPFRHSAKLRFFATLIQRHIRAQRASLTFLANLEIHFTFKWCLGYNGSNCTFFVIFLSLFRSLRLVKGNTSTQRGIWPEGWLSFSSYQSRPGEIQVQSKATIISYI